MTEEKGTVFGNDAISTSHLAKHVPATAVVSLVEVHAFA